MSGKSENEIEEVNSPCPLGGAGLFLRSDV